MKAQCTIRTRSLLAGLLVCAITGWPGLSRSQTTDIALQGVGLLGFQGAVDSTPGTLYFHVGSAVDINDGDLTTHVDNWSGGVRGTNGVSFVGIVWPTVRWESVSSVTVTMAAFVDGGWFGPNGQGPGAGGALTSDYLIPPVVQVCTNLVNTNYGVAWGLLPVNIGIAPTNGVEATSKWFTTNGNGIPVWSTVASTSDYMSGLTGQTIGGGANPNPQPLTFTITFNTPVTNITGIRVIGQNGGTADTYGFLGIFELDVEGKLIDTTGDGIADAWRVRYFGHPTAQAGDLSRATDDPDNDGLNNLQEFQAGTDPHNPDTDGDGLSDGDEVNTYFTNPVNPDTDGDGLSDGDEVNKYKTDPLKWDTDGDDLSDGQEVLVYGSDPLVLSTAGNGYSDGAMVQFGCFKPYVTPLNTNCVPDDLAISGTGILGVEDTTGVDTAIFNAGTANAINDGDLTTHVDNFPGGFTVGAPYSFVGILFSNTLTSTSGGSVSGLELTMATFVDGGWFGRPQVGPGGGGSLGWQQYVGYPYLAAPKVQTTADGGTTWSDVPSKTDYYVSFNAHSIGGGTNGNPDFCTATFFLPTPVTGINGIRILGTSGGTAGNGGFIGVSELVIHPFTDSDGDGIPDWWMRKYFGHPTGQTNDLSMASDDPDHDGLTNLQEYQNGTNPLKADTDGDGLSDGDEVNKYHTNPLSIDSDSDGLNDYQEVMVYHTDPLNPDTDGDLFPDGQEVKLGSDPNNAASVPADLALRSDASAILGTEDPTTGTDTLYYQAGVLANINDGDLTTHVDDWNNTGTDPWSYVGILWTNRSVTNPIVSLELDMAAFVDGGWFGVNNAGPGPGGVLSSNQYLIVPSVQASSDAGTTWTNVPFTSDYLSRLDGATIGGGTNPNPTRLTSTFTLTPPLTKINGIRLVGSEGGTASGGFLGVFEFEVLTHVAQPVKLLNVGAAAGQFRFEFDSQSGTVYVVQFKSLLTDPTWQTLTTLTGDGTRKQVTDSIGNAQRFYRVKSQ